MAYFDCIVGGSGKGNTLVVTCADELAGATITCTNGTKTYTKTCPSTAPYEVTFYGLAAGTYTVSATVSGNTYTTTVVVADIEALLGGFNWKTWVDLSENYTSSDFTDLDDLLSDETAIRELMTIHACVDYLADIATTSADVETIIGNDLCAKWINNRDYALDTLYANTIIADYMDTADKYFYGEWALMPQVPAMTSNTAPFGEVFASGYYSSGFPPYYAFNGEGTYYWVGGQSGSEHYLGYHFISPVIVKHFKYSTPSAGDANRLFDNLSLKGSNDGTNWTTIYSNTIQATIKTSYEFDVDNSTAYEYYAIFINKTVNGTTAVALDEVQFYAWQPKGNVPVMTSNTAPYGVASGSANASGYEPYKAFDGNYATNYSASSATTSADLIYKFVNPICVKRFLYYIKTTGATLTLYGSNDGTNYSNALATISSSTADSNQYVDVTNDDYYLYYKLHMTRSSNTQFPMCVLQFYGRELSVSVPKMTGNTTPYGEVGGNRYVTDDTLDLYGAFNQVTSNYVQVQNGGKIYYKFNRPTVVKKVGLFTYSSVSDYVNNMQLVGSNDNGATWQNIGTAKTPISQQAIQYFDYTDNEEAFSIIGISVNAQNGHNPAITILQFYGLDYSEKEFEEGTTKKWLYDHGVELETLRNIVGNNGGSVVKNDNSVSVTSGTNNTSGVANRSASGVDNIDVTPYSLMHVNITSPLTTSINIGVYQKETTQVADALAAKNITSFPTYQQQYLDISQVNQIGYVACGTYDSNHTITFEELWLE